MRVMAIDYGDRRIGLAVSDERQILVGDAWTMNGGNMERAAKRIAEEVQARNVGLLVLERAALSREFAAILTAETGLEVKFWDERRSSIEAHAVLHANGRKEKDHRKNVDAVAASLMLEGYLRGL